MGDEAKGELGGAGKIYVVDPTRRGPEARRIIGKTHVHDKLESDFSVNVVDRAPASSEPFLL